MHLQLSMRCSRHPLVQLLQAVRQRQVGSQAIRSSQSARPLLMWRLPSQGRALQLQCQRMHMWPHTLSPMLRRMTMTLTDGRHGPQNWRHRDLCNCCVTQVRRNAVHCCTHRAKYMKGMCTS
jgi:hypothetical protein